MCPRHSHKLSPSVDDVNYVFYSVLIHTRSCRDISGLFKDSLVHTASDRNLGVGKAMYEAIPLLLQALTVSILSSRQNIGNTAYREGIDVQVGGG